MGALENGPSGGLPDEHPAADLFEDEQRLAACVAAAAAFFLSFLETGTVFSGAGGLALRSKKSLPNWLANSAGYLACIRRGCCSPGGGFDSLSRSLFVFNVRWSSGGASSLSSSSTMGFSFRRFFGLRLGARGFFGLRDIDKGGNRG